MKVVVTHGSPDLDAITSIWLIRKFLPGWESAVVKFVPAGERLGGAEVAHENFLVRDAKKASLSNRFKNPASSHDENFVGSPRQVIDTINGNEVIHVDTGLGPLDHHQTASDKVCAASLTWEYVRSQKTEDRRLRAEDRRQKTEKERDKEDAVSRMVKVVVDTDHFKEVFWPSPTADYYEFSIGAILDGLKLAKPNQDEYYVEFVVECLDAILHEFENRIWAEKEIATNGKKFETRFGKGIGFETINDSVLKLTQKMGYVVVVRKDPRKGYVRVKARPSQVQSSKFNPSTSSGLTLSGVERVKVQSSEIDLTLAYEKLRKMDPSATWFLHIGKKMLLNGSVKNPKMRPTRLGLGEIIKVLEKI